MIRYVERPSEKICEEPIYSQGFIRWAYQSWWGRICYEAFFNRRWFSELAGLTKDLASSRKEILAFIERYGIDMGESLDSIEDFGCFNDFFARRLKPEARPWALEPTAFPCWAEGRTWVVPKLESGTLLPVKGTRIGLAELLKNRELAQQYEGGAAVVIRLSPVDYHRYHFPDDGVPEHPKAIAGRYHSVNHLGLESGLPIYCLNRRTLTRFHSEHFGDILLIEVGAMAIARMKQTFRPNVRVERGQEKGYFKFGGSTVIALFEPGRIAFDRDLLDHSAQGFETLVKVGERIGVAL